MKEKTKKMKKLSDYNLSILFIIIIFFIPILTKIHPHTDISSFENRTLATPPIFNRETLSSGEYFDNWEEYLSDHIVGRNRWLKLYTYLNMNILRKNKINDIVISKDGTLLPFYAHNRIYDPETHKANIKKMANNIEELSSYVDEYGGKFCFIGIPEQSSYYRERYPDYFYNNYEFLCNSEKTMFLLLREKNIDFINMDEEFKKENRDDFYLKTDHHYSFRGAFKTYEKIINKIKNDFGLDIQGALDENEMDIITIENPILGSRNRQLYYLYPTSEKMEIAYHKEKIDYEKIDNGVKSPEFYHIEESPDERPSYGVFMGGDLAETVIKTNRSNLPNALIFGDSFTNAVEPLLYYHFNETRILDLRYYEDKSLYKYIEEYKPDVVIMIRDDLNYGNNEGNGNFNGK